jgi:hypothetical protein
MKHTIISEVKDGNLTRNRKQIKDVLRHFEGKVVTISIQRKKNARTPPQNRYYWGLIIPIWKELLLNEWGEYYTKEATHEFLKMNFGFDEVVNEETGEVLRRVRSTTENSTIEMEEYHDVCRKKAFEFFGAVIPLPNEDLLLDLD